ncbi:unnamed protein product [Prorocentrum cordatum]|uniref:Uncharacterized protein n=1 Tax=Prorocentrum cordatum TaxID=2364126 RepID=A0ABN9VAL3_9DINO|nr:unnamed protein product [Polarella glacialis]
MVRRVLRSTWDDVEESFFETLEYRRAGAGVADVVRTPRAPKDIYERLTGTPTFVQRWATTAPGVSPARPRPPWPACGLVTSIPASRREGGRAADGPPSDEL